MIGYVGTVTFNNEIPPRVIELITWHRDYSDGFWVTRNPVTGVASTTVYGDNHIMSVEATDGLEGGTGMRTAKSIWGDFLSFFGFDRSRQDDTPWKREESGLSRPQYGMRARGHLHSQPKRRLNARRAGHPL